MKIKTFEYSDPQKDDFAENCIDTVPTPEDFEYIPSSLIFRILSFIAYRIIARPVTYLYIKVAHHHKYVGKKKIKQVKGGCFFFGNHTLEAGDAFIPNHLSIRKNHIVSSPDATSIKGLKNLVVMMGALPVPSTVHGSIKFKAALVELIKKGRTVTIYPEAHIWPYYTKIRPFKSDPFLLPAETGAPCFAFTNVFLRSRIPFIKRPVVKTYIDGPFYPDMTLPKRQRAEKLRGEIYDAMVAESEKQEQYVTYIYKEKET